MATHAEPAKQRNGFGMGFGPNKWRKSSLAQQGLLRGTVCHQLKTDNLRPIFAHATR
jgi:hypothetical protein